MNAEQYLKMTPLERLEYQYFTLLEDIDAEEARFATADTIELKIKLHSSIEYLYDCLNTVCDAIGYVPEKLSEKTLEVPNGQL